MRKFIVALVAALGMVSTAQAKEGLEIGYMPIVPVAQAFLLFEDGGLERSGIRNPKLISFQNGPAMVQALLGGQLDIAYVGIGPALVANAKGADVKVIAANIVEQVSIVALGELAPYFESGPAATAFARFAADKGRKPMITIFPTGSVPETVLQYWLRQRLQIDPASIDIIQQGQAQVQQALLTGAVDGAAIIEPSVAIVTTKLPAARVVASGSELFPDQPGAVLLARKSLIDEHPELVQKLVEAHIEATERLRNDPASAVAAVGKHVGGGRLESVVVERALENSRRQFVADPRSIIDSTVRMRDFQAQIGTLEVEVDVGKLFDVRFYEAARGTR